MLCWGDSRQWGYGYRGFAAAAAQRYDADNMTCTGSDMYRQGAAHHMGMDMW
jgi:hypothetical protein